MRSILRGVRIWAEMVRLSHSVFALPFALTAAFLAGRNIPESGRPSLGQLGLVVLCMVAARSVAMTFNRMVDAEIDARNPRTANRALPAGRLSRMTAYIMLVLSMLTFGVGCLGFMVLHGNVWPVVLSGPILILVAGYSFTKRFTRWSHFYLGAVIATSPVATWIAVHPPSLGLEAFLLLCAVTGWIAGFDIIYSCQDVEVDRREGLHSLPAKVGVGRALWVGRIAHTISGLALVALGWVAQLGTVYLAGLSIVLVLLVLENAIVRAEDLRRVPLAFALNGLVSLLFGAAAIGDVLLRSGPVGV